MTCEPPPACSAQVLRLSAVGIGLLYGSVKLKHYQVRRASPTCPTAQVDPVLCTWELQARDLQAEVLLYAPQSKVSSAKAASAKEAHH